MNELTVDTEKHDAKAAQELALANALIITTEQEYHVCDAHCRGLLALRKSIEADFAPSIAKARESKQAATEALATLVSQQQSHTFPVQNAERVRKAKMMVWSDEQEAIRRKEQDRLRDEARRKAEDEALAKATKLEAQGKTAQAEAVLERPVKPAPIVLAPAQVERETVISKYWSYTVTDPMSVKREFCKPDAGSIQTQMNAYKRQGKTTEEAAALIGGIVIEERVK